jgi:hypothetical protein
MVFSIEEQPALKIATAALDQPGDRRLGLWQSEREMATLNRATG